MRQLVSTYFFLIFPAVLILTGILPFLVAQMSGWAALGRRFRAAAAFPGETWGLQSARMRWGINYNNCLIVGADPTGLYLCMMFIFRLGMPPLLLPWQEITVERRWKGLFFHYVELRLGQDEQIPFRIRESLADKIKAAAGPNWPVETIS
jgi:hypothetical protein